MTLSYDDPSTPLHQVTFCVVDLETTGTSSSTCAITEVGAARFRGGECLGTFRTLVDTGVPVPPVVARLTGITEEMVAGAPPLPGVLAALSEFAGGDVLVGHNLRFDVSFLDAALTAGARGRLRLRMVDTVALARGLIGADVPDCRLATLAEHLRLPHRPTHRALDDVLATADLLHALLEQAAGAGVVTLEDLLTFPRLAGHAQAAKLPLTNGLPREQGIYVLRDGRGRALYVGVATDIRRRVRSFFGRGQCASEGRTVRQLVRAVQRIDHVSTRSALHSLVASVRVVQALDPRHNRASGRWRRFRYVRVPGKGGRGRATVVSTVRGDAVHVGPFPTMASARAVASAVEAESCGPSIGPEALVARLARRVDGDEPGGPGTGEGCRSDDGVPGGPSALRARDGDGGGPGALSWSDRVALEGALGWLRRIEALRRAERLVLRLPEGHHGGAEPAVELRRGQLVFDPPPGPAAPASGDLDGLWPALACGPPVPAPGDGPLPREVAEELDAVATWLDRHAGRVRLVHVDGELSCPWPAPTARPSSHARPPPAAVA